MGCNVDKAKADIYDILTEDQKDFSESSIKRTEQLAELISEKLDSEIKSKFVMSINDKNKNNTSNTSEKKSSEEFSANFLKERPSAKGHLPKELNKYNASTQAIADGRRNSTADFINRFFGSNLSNTGKYNKDDVVFISTNGNRTDRVIPVINGELQGAYKNIDLAIAAGASFVADTENHLKKTSKYNVGEIDIANYLESKGYKRYNQNSKGYGFWKKVSTDNNEQSKDNDTSDNTNNNKDENKHSALVKAESILKDIDKANSEVSKFIKPLMRDYFNSKRLSVKPFVNAISLALNGDIGQKATAQKGIDAIFEITRTMDQKDVPFEKFTNEEINFLVDNHFMSEPETMAVDKKDLDLNVKQTTINFDDINIFGSQNRTNENIEESGSFSNTIGGLLESLVDVNDTSAYGKNMINIATTMIDTLSNYGLNKTLKVNIYSIKDKNDRYTRASFAMDANSTATERIDPTTGNVIGFDLEAGEISLFTGYGYDDELGDISLNTVPELLVHEIFHSMIEKAVEADPKLSRDIFKIKEYVMERLSPEDFFASKDAYNNATNEEKQLAKDLYSYMHKPTEFLIYTMTTRNIYDAVSKISITKELLAPFKEKQGVELSKMKEFFNKFINIINNVYTKITTKKNAILDLNQAISEAITLNTEIDIGKVIKKGYSEYEVFGLGQKLNKTNEWLKEGERGAFEKMSNIFTSDRVRDKTEAASNFLENIWGWRHFQFIRDSRIISDTVTDIVEDTTREETSWFYEAVRKIKNNRDKDKVDFAAVMRNKVGEQLKDFDKSERESLTFMLQGDWKALGVTLEEYKELLQDDNKVKAKVDELKAKINIPEYSNQAALLGYYIVNGEAKGSALLKNAYQIYYRFHTGKASSPHINELTEQENIKAIDELASLYAILYTQPHTKEGIVNAINRDSDVVEFISSTNYGYRAKEESGQLGQFAKYADKGYVRKSGKVKMKFDIVPESKLIDKSWFNFLKHTVVRERPDIQEMLGSNEKHYMIIDRNYDTARTQGALDDISIVDHGQEIGSFLAGKDLTFEQRLEIRKKRFRKDKTYLNSPIDDSLEALQALENYSIAEFSINGDVESYSESISEADLINHGRVINDVADVIANTTSHIESKEKALINNQRFIDLLIEDSEENIGAKGYVFLSPDAESKEIQEYWAMIPNYSRQYIVSATNTKGIWVKRSRINNIVGYKDVSLSNLKLFGIKLEDYPKWQKAIRIVENIWKDIASQYKAIIVKLMPDVVVGNGLSNMIVAFKHGIGPLEYAKEFKQAWTDLSDYLELNEQKIWLQIQRDSGKKGLDIRIEEIEDRMKKNGMHNLIEDGQFSMIFEDIENNTEERFSHLEDILRQKTEDIFGKKTADRLESIRENVYITKNTRGHRAIEKLTIYNDIINKRIIEKKLLQDMEKITFNDDKAKDEYRQDMYNYLDQLFTNYGYLLNKYVKYPSDMNFLMFIKYFLRQGKAILSTARRQPLGSIVAEAVDSLVWDMPDPIDQYQDLFGTLGNKIGASPIDVFGELIYPRFLTVLGN